MFAHNSPLSLDGKCFCFIIPSTYSLFDEAAADITITAASFFIFDPPESISRSSITLCLCFSYGLLQEGLYGLCCCLVTQQPVIVDSRRQLKDLHWPEKGHKIHISSAWQHTKYCSIMLKPQTNCV